MNAKIKEIFISTQGEGPFIGVKQMFIRFCGCNLNCGYCDTDFVSDEDSMELTPEELVEKIKACKGYEQIHSISLTGGEPLLAGDFLKEFLPKVEKPVYLETNATLYKEIPKIFDYVVIISADIKLQSATGSECSFEDHDRFFNSIKEATLDCAVNRQYNCKKPYVFAKVVFDENITDSEIIQCVLLVRRYNLDLILQPKMNSMTLEIPIEKMEEIFDKFLELYSNVRLIPQVHKFLNIR